MKTTGKSAFTLLELIVVIGIIGILMGVALSQFGGSTESAKAAKCETNMRNLVTAAHTYALAQDDGHYPSAGSYSYKNFNTDRRSAKLEYHNYATIGWISGSENRDGPKRDGVTKDPVAFQAIPLNADEKSILHALTNGCHGAMWKAMGANRTAYQCPVHAEAIRKATKRSPGWSYVMNRAFGCALGSDKNNYHWRNKHKLNSNEDSKILMFAELQGVNINLPKYPECKAELEPKGGLADAILDYESQEVIGFNHKISTRGYTGHVAFMDGHVEKLAYPRSGISLEKLTEALCKGHEISYNVKEGGYKDLNQ